MRKFFSGLGLFFSGILWIVFIIFSYLVIKISIAVGHSSKKEWEDALTHALLNYLPR